MHAMQMKELRKKLEYVTLPCPIPNKNEILVKVLACGVCRADLHVVDGELKKPKLPLIPGHQIVGRVAAKGEYVSRFQIGDRIGIPWLGNSCNHCDFCLKNEENLCDEAKFTGYQINGGFAEYQGNRMSDQKIPFNTFCAYSGCNAAL